MSLAYTAERMPYKDLLWDLAFRVGRNPDASLGGTGLSGVDDAKLVRFLSNAYKQVWEKPKAKNWVWPWLVQTTTLTPTNGVIPLSDVDYARWLSLWNLDPRNPATVGGYSIRFTLDGDGIHPLDNTVTAIFAFYIQRTPEFSSTPIGTTTAWGINTICYNSSDGECYRALVEGALGTQVADATKWRVQPVYKNFQSAVVQLAHAIWLRSTNEFAEAREMENLGWEDLEDEYRAVYAASPPAARDNYYATGTWC